MVKYVKEVFQKIWKFLLVFAIRRRPPPPPPLFSFAIESYLYETHFTPGPCKNYHSAQKYVVKYHLFDN